MNNLFQRLVIHNFGLKVFSLALAVALWAALSREPRSEVAISLPIEFRHMPDNLEINSEHIPTAEVRVRGPERLVSRLRPDEVHVRVDLNGVKAGERTFDLSAQQIREPRDLEVVQVVPSQIQLSFDERSRRQVQVHPRIRGDFASGLRLAKATADPVEVTITGPRSRVEAIDFASTDAIDASGVTSTQTFSTHIFIPDPLIQVVNPTAVHVTVMMERTSANPGSN